ncbi:MAG: hypothetical protein K2Q24_15375 [Chitinophagaceae bacterium]|jgi:anti-sigma factor RsiW|nr:hypothetical protein [Chitinophagaceae bacterium]
MSDKLLDILKDHPDISEQEMLDYLNGNLTPDQRYEMEKRLASSDMMSDAEEGLSQVKNNEQVKKAVADLNKQLHLQLQQQRRKRKLLKMPNQTLLIVTTFLLLLLITLAFVIIYKIQVK